MMQTNTYDFPATLKIHTYV